MRDYIKIIAITSFYTLCAGCACGFVGTSIAMMGLVILVCSILVVVSGIYTGYHFGFESKTGAYAARSTFALGRRRRDLYCAM